MLATTLRDRRWPLALTLAILGACADEPSAPSFSLPKAPNADVADSYLVTNTNDTGIGSLRWALSFTTGGEAIRFDPSIAGQTIALDSSLYIRKSVTIEGPASAGITVSGRGTWRVFDTGFTGTLTVRNLAVTGGYSRSFSGLRLVLMQTSYSRTPSCTATRACRVRSSPAER